MSVKANAEFDFVLGFLLGNYSWSTFALDECMVLTYVIEGYIQVLKEHHVY